MLLAVILVFAVYVLIVVGGFIFTHFNKVNHADYEVVTKAPKKMLIFFIVFMVLGSAACLAGFITVFILPADAPTPIGLTAIGAFFGLICSLMVLTLLNQFEAISGRTIYYRRFKKIKQFSIDDIGTIDFVGANGFVFSDKTGRRLLTVATMTINAPQLLELINARKDQRIHSNIYEIDKDPDPAAEPDVTLIDIGKTWRESYRKRRKRTKLGFMLAAVGFCLAPLAGAALSYFYDTTSRAIFFLIAAIVFPILFGVMAKRNLASMDRELSASDEQLGHVHKLQDKRVKGYHQRMDKAIKIFFFAPAILVAVGAVFLGATYSQHPLAESKFTAVSGEIEYFGTIRSGDYILAFYDNPMEYHIEKKYVRHIDRSVFNGLAKGDLITISLDPSDKANSMNPNDRARKEYRYFYTMSSAEKDYVSYDDYVYGFEKNNLFPIVFGYVFAGSGVALVITLTALHFTYGRSTKGEYLEF